MGRTFPVREGLGGGQVCVKGVFSGRCHAAVNGGGDGDQYHVLQSTNSLNTLNGFAVTLYLRPLSIS